MRLDASAEPLQAYGGNSIFFDINMRAVWYLSQTNLHSRQP
jgi:hypothetical protein